MSDTLPTFYVTGLAKALVGENPCLLQPWFAGRKLLPKTTSEAMTRWKAEHTELLQQEASRSRFAGWKVTAERFIRVTGETAIVSGKPDLVLQAEGKRPRVVDVKSGEPKDYYVAQVALYLTLLPLAWQRPGWTFDGELVYADGTRVPVRPEQGEALRPKLFTLVRRLASEERPVATPSEGQCRFCAATVELCPERMLAAPQAVLTSEW